MPQPPSAYDLHQRQRWLRHDAHLWIRHDFARWLKPGTDPAEVYPHLKRQREAAEDAAFAAQIAASHRFLAELRAEVDELKAALARRRLEEAKYSPDQPRIPKRNPGGGQFTRIGGGIGQSPSANVAQPMGNVDVGDVTGSSDVGGVFSIAPGSTGTDAGNSSESIGKVAADDSERRYSVDLQEEEARGGHTIRDHVGKTDDYLIGFMNADYKRFTSGNLEITEFRDAEGSFATREQANDHVNQLLKLERDKVDQVATGMEKKLTLESRIGSVTGYEAFRPNGDSDPYIRDTYSVRAVIINDSRSPRGYTVRTAFPVNQRPGRR
jgi:hypothetical protein